MNMQINKVYYNGSFEQAIVNGRSAELMSGTLVLPYANHLDTFEETLDVLEALLDTRDRDTVHSCFINTAIVRCLGANMNGLNSFLDDRAAKLWKRMSLNISDYTSDVSSLNSWEWFECVRDARLDENSVDMEIQDLILMYHWDHPKWSKLFITWCNYSTQICELESIAKIAHRVHEKNDKDMLREWRKAYINIVANWPMGEPDTSLRILPMEERLLWYAHTDSFYRVSEWRKELKDNMAAKRELLDAWSYIVANRKRLNAEDFVETTHDDIMETLISEDLACAWEIMTHVSMRSDIDRVRDILFKPIQMRSQDPTYDLNF